MGKAARLGYSIFYDWEKHVREDCDRKAVEEVLLEVEAGIDVRHAFLEASQFDGPGLVSDLGMVVQRRDRKKTLERS
jgi:hypothetical protein